MEYISSIIENHSYCYSFWSKSGVLGSTKKTVFLGIIPKQGGVGIPRLYVKFWWPLFLAIRFTFLFLNLAKIHIFIPKSAKVGGGVHQFRNYS